MKKRVWQFITLGLLCVTAAVANELLHSISLYYMKTPLYIDTLFTAAVCFAAGLAPGLVTALIPGVVFTVITGSFTPFILCSIAEVFFVYLLKPSLSREPAAGGRTEKEKSVAVAAGIFARLMVLYIVCALAISVLGGVIDFIYYDVLLRPNEYFNPEDTFKIGLLDSGIHILFINILSRIPVNIVDRFIVIFGGYGVSLFIRKIPICG